MYGFKKDYNPIIFTLDGKFIGDMNAFSISAQTKFGIDVNKLENAITTEVIYLSYFFYRKESYLKIKIMYKKKRLI